jgi:hypothetical protein
MRAIDAATPVVTGTGLVTALGFGVSATFEALLAGRTGIVPTGDVAIESGAGLAALVARPFLRSEPPDELRTQVKFLNGAGELATQAAHDAWRDAAAEDAAAPEASGLWLSQMDTWDWPCVDFQTAVRDATDDLTRPLEAEALNRSSVRRTKPFFLLDSLKNNAFSFVTRWWSLRGANTGVAGFAGPTLGLLDLAARAIARGDQERALVVAAARAANGVLRRDLVLHGLSRPSGDPASRPLDSRGTGCVLGEAAAALTVERQETASARGAEVRAILPRVRRRDRGAPGGRCRSPRGRRRSARPRPAPWSGPASRPGISSAWSCRRSASPRRTRRCSPRSTTFPPRPAHPPSPGAGPSGTRRWRPSWPRSSSPRRRSGPGGCRGRWGSPSPCRPDARSRRSPSGGTAGPCWC